MKALTLHQPWALLVASGVKTIETRSWRTHYRGPLAIHASKGLPPGAPKTCVELREAIAVALGYQESYPLAVAIEPLRPDLRGVVLATCMLIDCVPITGSGHGHPDSATRIADFPHDGPLPHQKGGLWLVGPNGLTDGRPTRIEHQRNLGDFIPGRWAWLLADIRPLGELVTARGRQGLWEWGA